MYNMSSINIMQLNIKSINSSKNQLEHFISINNIDIAILSEIWLKPNSNFSIKNFKLVSSCRTNGYGGVAFLIKNDINFNSTSLNQLLPIEALQITTTNLKDNLNLITLYIPPNINKNVIQSKFNSLINIFNNINNTLIAGDINAHSLLWECNSKIDTRGTIIADAINLSNFIVLNNGDHTYISDSTGNTSAVDITLAHINIAPDLEWIKTFETLDSDHFVLKISYRTNKISYKIKKQKLITNYKLIKKDINSLDADDLYTINEFEKALGNILQKNTFQPTDMNKYIPKYWWNNDIKNLWLIKNHKLKLFTKYKSNFTKIEYKKAKAKLKLNIKISKRNSFQQFINEINPNTSIKDIYSKINLFNDKKKNSSNYNFNDQQIKDFLEFNFTNHNSNYLPNFNFSKINESDYEIFKVQEITDIISKNKNTSPGHNKISNKILKFLNENSCIKLTNLMNLVMKEQIYPESWKQIKVVPILKPDKNPELITSYRPIALINSLTKIFNKLLKNRLDKHIGKHNILPELSFAFQRFKSTHQCVAFVLTEIQNNTYDNYLTFVIVTDISKAFDNIILQKLIHSLQNINFNPNYINMIHQFLFNRQYSLSNVNKTEYRVVYDGIPQGSTISTTFFNVYTKCLHDLSTENEKIVQFADDFTIIIKARTVSEILNRAKNFLIKFNYQLKELNLKLNFDKCSSIIFNHKQDMFNLLDININNQVIHNKTHVKILGITLDAKLNFNLNTKLLKENCNRNLNILKIFSKIKGGAHPQSMINIYKATINSRIFYSTVLTKLNKQNLDTIQKIQNQALRICMGYIKTTPITTIIAESCQFCFVDQDEYTTTRFILKQIYLNNFIAKQLVASKALTKFEDLQTKFQLLFVTPHMPELPATINNFDFNIKNYTLKTDKEKLVDIRKIIDAYVSQKYFIIYTDGSKTIEKNGVGMYFHNTKEKIGYKIPQNLTIKSLEMLAIFLGIKFAITMKHLKIVVMTDSLNSIKSIISNLKNTTNKYLERKILNLLANNPNVKVLLKWIPAHIGLIEHDYADMEAKNAINVFNLTKMPPEDVLLNIHNFKIIEFKDKFLSLTETKGLFYKELINELPLRTFWFYNENYNSRLVKLLNRLRSGHCFDKKTLYIMKIIDNNTCNICNTVENAEHILLDCIQYNNIRIKYKCLATIPRPNYITLLRNKQTYEFIYSFLLECNISL